MNNNRLKEWDKIFINIAKEMSKMSTCCRKQVCCLIVKNNRIISTGINGVPSGIKHCNDTFSEAEMLKPYFMERHRLFSSKYELHAEQNALCECAKNEVSPKGATAYLTLSPCSQCAKLLLSAGISRVVYCEEYDRDSFGIDFLKENKVNIEFIGD